MKNIILCYVKTSYGYTDIKPGDDCTRYERELTKSMCEVACTKMYVGYQLQICLLLCKQYDD